MTQSIDTARGHTTSGARINEVTIPTSEQNSSAPIVFRKPASFRKARCPIAEAARRAATATNPRMRGAIILLLTARVRIRHEIGCRPKGPKHQTHISGSSLQPIPAFCRSKRPPSLGFLHRSPPKIVEKTSQCRKFG